jgi:hypothetical protein
MLNILKQTFLKPKFNIIFYKYLSFKQIINTKEPDSRTKPKMGASLFAYHLFEALFTEEESSAIDYLKILRNKFNKAKIPKNNKLTFYFYARSLEYLNFTNEKKYFRYTPKKGAALFAYLIFKDLIEIEDKDQAYAELKKQREEFTQFFKDLISEKA